MVLLHKFKQLMFDRYKKEIGVDKNES
jgi:hypothetical protein